MLRKENRARSSVKAALNSPVCSGLCRTVSMTTPIVYVNVPNAFSRANGAATRRMCMSVALLTSFVNHTNFFLATAAESTRSAKLPPRKARDTS